MRFATGWTKRKRMKNNSLLKLDNISLSYRRRVVSQVSFEVYPGEILALVGESGCGKTTLLKSILGLSDRSVSLDSGRMSYAGIDLQSLSYGERKNLLGKEVSMVFQDPGATFNPIRSYRKQFHEMLKSQGLYEGKKTDGAILDCFDRLHLPDGKRILECCPYEMSGGMNQRIAIAAVMMLKPRLLLADEPTSALDVTAQKLVVEELMKLRDLTGTAMIIVTHNLSIASRMANRTGIMYAGHLVEYGDTENVLQHPYTKSLIAAVPILGGALPKGLEGQMPLYGAELSGCAFRERCPVCSEKCSDYQYSMRKIKENHMSCCTEEDYGTGQTGSGSTSY